MAKRAGARNARNHWRQREYLRIGVVMLPPMVEERRAVKNLNRKKIKEALNK